MPSVFSLCMIYNDVSYLVLSRCCFVIFQACDVLSKPQRSLAYLLDTYCGIVTNKLLQVYKEACWIHHLLLHTLLIPPWVAVAIFTVDEL